MRNMRFLRPLFHLLLMHQTTGCVVVLGDGFAPGDGNGGNGVSASSGSGGGDGPTSVLPEPEERRVDAPLMTPDQQARQFEADAYTAEVIYKGRPIVKTVQGYSGTIYDYIEVPPLDIEVPDLTTLLPELPADGIQLGLTEVEKYSELWGPINSTVFVRPDFSRYVFGDTGAMSIQDWVDNYQIQGIPNGEKRLYAGLNMPVANRGIIARINAFAPRVEKGTFSVVELAVACPAEGADTEMIGIMLMMDWANYEFAPQLSVDTEFWRETNGVREGSFGNRKDHFVQLPLIRSTDVGAPLDPEHISVPGGEQWEHLLYMIMDPNGRWWFGYNDGYFGYYPAELFTMLNTGACRAQAYAEVYNPHPELGWVRTEMGSGQFPDAPDGHVAWIRQLRYFDTNWWPTEPFSDDVVHWSKPNDTRCYSRNPLAYQGSAGPLMLFGGPGGYRAECAAIKPSP